MFFALARAVNKDVVYLNFAFTLAHDVAVGFDNVSIVGQNDMIIFHSYSYRQSLVRVAMEVLSMNGDQVSWFEQFDHQFYFFLLGMTGGVNVHMSMGDDLRPLAEQVIGHVNYGFFIANNWI